MSDLTRIVALRELLDQPPSAALWQELLRYVRTWQQAPDLDVDLAYIDTHIAHWPDHLRSVPEGYKQQWLALRGPMPPYFQLFRSLSLTEQEIDATDRRPRRGMMPGTQGLHRLLFNEALPSITHLSFSKCNIQSEDFKAIANSQSLSQLKSLGFRHQWFDARSLETLLSSRHLEGLRCLDLSHSFLKDKYAMILAQIGHPTIEELILSSTGIDIRGAQAILGSLMWPSLRSLSLRNNRFGRFEEHQHSSYSFQDPFATECQLSLTSLDLGENWLHPSQGDALVERGYIEGLEHLDVERSDFAASFVKALLQRQQRRPFHSLNLRHLHHIDLDDAQQLLAMCHDLGSLRCPWPLPGVDLGLEAFHQDRWPKVQFAPGTTEEQSKWTVPSLTFAGATGSSGDFEECQSAWGYNVNDGLFTMAEGTGEEGAGATFAQCLVGGLVAWAQATGVKGEHWRMTPDHHIDEWRPWRMDHDQSMGPDSFSHPMQWLLYRVVHLAQLLLDLQGEAIEYVGAQAELLALQLWGDQLGIVHVGSLQLFRIRDGALSQLTDSLLPEEITRREGAIPDNTYMMSLNERSYRAALGNPQTNAATVQIEDIREHDVMILCTQHVSEHLTHTQLLEVANHATPATSGNCRALLDHVPLLEQHPNDAVLIIKVEPEPHE